ncbi:hypothetical protein pipiens_000917, partial [Culex pipiens pipiens]
MTRWARSIALRTAVAAALGGVRQHPDDDRRWNVRPAVTVHRGVQLVSTLLSGSPSMGGTQALAQPQFSYASGATYVPKLAPNATGQKFKNNRTQLTLGYLTALKGNMKDKQGLTISGALTIALEEINNDPDLPPNVTLALRWYDTRGETVTATRHITEMICDGVSAIFGPEGTCKTEAIVSQSRDIPMISY